MYYSNSNRKEVTLGEVLVSIIIIIALLAVGVLISNKISISIANKNEVYQSAFKISEDEKDLFKYAMKTDIGNSLIYGDINAVDTVKYDELTDGYLCVKRITEKYTENVTYEDKYDDDGNVIGQERKVSRDWEYYRSDEVRNNKISFMGVEFNSSKFNFSPYYERLSLSSSNVQDKYSNKISWNNYLYTRSKTWHNVGDIRYRYEIVPINLTGTIFASLKENNMLPIESRSIKLYKGDIEHFLMVKESNVTGSLVVFWITWILFIAILIVVFVMNRNRWLDMDMSFIIDFFKRNNSNK